MAKDKKQKESSQEQKAPDQARHSAKERPRLRARFEKEVAPALLKELELKNVMAVPRLHKIVVNMGVGEATQNAKVLDPAVNELDRILSVFAERVRTEECDGGSAAAQDCRKHGCGRSHAERESARSGGKRT